MRRWRFLTALVASTVVFTAASCSGDTAKDAARSVEQQGAANESAPRTAVDELLGQIDATGHLPLDASLQLVSVLYGPLTGVSTPDGDPGELEDGTLALRAVANHWDELSVERQAAILDAYSLPEGWAPASTAVDGAGPGRAIPTRPTDEPGVEVHRAAIDRALRALEAQLGPLGVPVVVDNGDNDTDSAARDVRVRADTALTNGACRVRVFPSRITPSTTGPDPTLTHELFHCFQMVWDPSWNTEPQWVAEGTAVWVSQALMASSGGDVNNATARGYFRTYYRSESLPTFERNYDAVGFFAHAAARGVDLWVRLPEIVRGGNTGAWNAVASAAGPEWLATFPSSFLRNDWGPQWIDTWPGIPSGVETRTSIVYVPVGNGVSEALTSDPAGARYGGVSLDAEITTITVGSGTAGYVHHDGSTRAVADLDGRWCTGPECTCPPDTRRAGTTFPALANGRMTAALTGGLESGAFAVAGQSLRDVCDEELACPVGTWIMNAPPQGLPFRFLSGGVGTKLTVEADGTLTFDYASFQPIDAVVPPDDARYHAQLNGLVTGRVDIPSTGTFTSAPLLDANASGLTGSGSVTLDGVTVLTLGDADLRDLIGLADEYGPMMITCVSPEELTVGGGGVTHFYKPWR